MVRVYAKRGKLYGDFKKFGGKREAFKLDDTPKNRKFVTTIVVPARVKELVTGVVDEKVSKTLDAFAQEHFELMVGLVRELTIRDYRSIYSHRVGRYLGSLRLNEIDVITLKKWQGQLVPKYAKKSIMAARNILNILLEEAIDEGYLKDNPLKRVKVPKIAKPSLYRVDPFSLEEIELIVREATDWHRNYVIVAFFTGMRPEELIALRWDDVSFAMNEISIERTMRLGILGDTKTNASNRVITMLPMVKEALRHQYLRTGLQDGNVFLSNVGEPFKTPLSINERWKRIVKRSGVRYRNPYQTRHTFASIMLSNGESLLWVSKTMGHKDATTTLSRYSRFVGNKEEVHAEFLAPFAHRIQNGSSNFKGEKRLIS